MSNSKDLKNYNIRTDLVVDIMSDDFKDNNVIVTKNNYKDIDITSIEVKNENNTLSKKKGKYITISFKDITDSKNFNNVLDVLTNELKKVFKYLNIGFLDKCLVIGLGNKDSTPDSLGPCCLDNILVTRYLYDIEKIDVDPNYRNVSAFSPGVSGNTGIESSDIILGIVGSIKPDFLIIIDSLASSSIERVNKTIQITTTGINPGSGVYNNRGELSYETLGVKTVAIGIPTVIEANVLVSDTIKYIFKNFSYKKDNFNKNKLVPIQLQNYINYKDNLSFEEKKKLLGEIGILEEDDIKELIYEVLTPIGYNMMITPKEIDYFIKKSSNLISKAINKSLHKKYDI